jgi:hypothetical protein
MQESMTFQICFFQYLESVRKKSCRKTKSPPVRVETEAITPTSEGLHSRCAAKRGSTGLFEIVELKLSKSPVPQSRMNGLDLYWLMSL